MLVLARRTHPLTLLEVLASEARLSFCLSPHAGQAWKRAHEQELDTMAKKPTKGLMPLSAGQPLAQGRKPWQS